jgi:glycosyltransferase involved in cell wall biosynthesis
MKPHQILPLFSVVIPVYNSVNFVSATLESVLSQTFTDFETIIVNDGSTDGTRNVLEQYADHFRVIHQKNRGPGAARNRGIREASGRYVAFLDSDDLWFPWTLEVFAQALSRYADPAWVIGQPVRFSDPVTLRDVRCDTSHVVWYDDFYALLEEEHHKVYIGSNVSVCRTDALRTAGGFVEGERNAEDTDLIMRTGRMPGFVRILSPVTVAYRQHEHSLTGSLEGVCRGLLFLMAQEESGAYPNDPASRRERAKAIALRGRIFSFRCLNGGRLDLGLELYRRTFRFQCRARHFRYLAGHPVRAAMTWLKKSVTRPRF